MFNLFLSISEVKNSKLTTISCQCFNYAPTLVCDLNLANRYRIFLKKYVNF